MLLLYLFLLLLLHLINYTSATSAYTATDFILLSCGAESTTTDLSSRSWDTDARSRYSPPNAADISSSSPASLMHSSVSQVPYDTARVFHSPFTYTFPVLAGPKFLRLYFYPENYSGHDTSLSFFSVTANAFTLLTNFSAFLNSPSPSEPSFMKEFVINIQRTQRLNLTFTPDHNTSAFVNGIEIVSIPDTLYYKGNDQPIKFVNDGGLMYLRSDTALENLYRLNVGGNDVRIQDDSGPTRGMFRAWTQDDNYVLFDDYGRYTPHAEYLQIKYTNETPPYSAPEIVYTTSRVIANGSTSLNWRFAVDSGFNYLVRLHFCEIQLEVTKQNQRVFDILIDNQTAETEADVIFWTRGTEIPIFRDYMVYVSPHDGGRRGKKDLFLSLIPNLEGHPLYTNALLNGLEMFKVNDSDGSLAAANPERISSPSAVGLPLPETRRRGSSTVTFAAVGSTIGVLAVVAAVTFLILRRRRQRVKDTSDTTKSWAPLSLASRSTTRTSGSGVSLPSDLCRYFSLDEIKTATSNFDADSIIGKGGFGNVYRGLIDGGATAVAIKRLNPSSNQGAREFLTEIEMLSKLRHLHLVSLIGYSDDSGEMILVYDYMSNGTLRDHLYNSDNSPLTWTQRLRICTGAARGLHYLHTGAKQHAIIHRDVKSTNILLDDKWIAKMSDFGLSRAGPTGGADGNTHVSTVVKGSFGYVDPEYYRRQQLTDKSDVYSFGVVLFEVLCARPAIIPSLPKEQVNLAEWAKLCYRKGTIERIVDSNLAGQIAPECLGKFVETAVTCLNDKGIERPAMSDVVWSLEFAMQLQEAAERRDGGDFAMSPSFALVANMELKTTTSDEDMFSGTSEDVSRSKSSGVSTISSGKLNSGDVFSEIMNPVGR